MTDEDKRKIFDTKMEYVTKITGRNPKMSLLMSCGPEDAEIFYKQMFACFCAGIAVGMELK